MVNQMKTLKVRKIKINTVLCSVVGTAKVVGVGWKYAPCVTDLSVF